MNGAQERASGEARFATPEWAVTPENVAVTADIECGSGVDLRVEAPDRISVSPGEDRVPREVQVKGPISCYNMCVLVHNRADAPRDLLLEVRIPAWLREAGFDYFLRKPYLTCGALAETGTPDLTWRDHPAGHQENLGDVVQVSLHLQPGERRAVSTVPHYPYSACCRRLEELAPDHAGARLAQIGSSVQGRPILALEVGDEAATRRAAFTGTLQPGEPSAWAVVAMAEAALAGDTWLRQPYRLCFVPQPNPDGIVLGRSNVNARHELAGFQLEQAAHGEPCAPEAGILWDYLAQDPPSVLVDFHFLSLPDHPIPKPYFFAPEIYDDESRRAAAIELNDRLMALSGCERPYAVEMGHPFWRGLLTYQAAARWDTVSFLYQYTGPRTSHQAAQMRGPQVMRAALEVCRHLS